MRTSNSLSATLQRKLLISSVRKWTKSAAYAAALLTSSIALVGCGPTKHEKSASRAVEAYVLGDPARAAEKLRPLAERKDENFVLNNCRLGSSALATYNLTDAENAFLNAYEVINSLGVNNGGRSLGASLVDEKIKIWKGEPFERAMANFYLGLVYYMRRDYDNARAAFENSLFKLREYADKNEVKKDDYTERESDFAISWLMLGRCWQKLGREDEAAKYFAKLQQSRPDLASVSDARANSEANVLLVVDFGYAPRKETDFNSTLSFVPTPIDAGKVPPMRVLIDGRSQEVDRSPPIDTIAMAADRRWQSFDTFRVVKSAIGTGLIAGGAGYGVYRAGNGHMSNNDAAVTAGLIATGLLLKATSQADVRQWEMLPRTTFVLPMKLSPGTHEVTVTFPAVGLSQTWKNLPAPATGDATYYFRMMRYREGPFDFASEPTVAGATN